jgi:hypothetical protein
MSSTPAANSTRSFTYTPLRRISHTTEMRDDGRHFSRIHERRAYLTEIYRNSLARMVRSLAYEIQTIATAGCRDCGFEIVRVSDTLLEMFSQRSKQRDEAIDAFTRENGCKPTDNEFAVVLREPPADKQTEFLPQRCAIASCSA